MGISITNSFVTGRGGDIAIRDYRPATPTAATPLLWVHGGGFSNGGLDQRESDAPARMLAAEGRWVRTLDYRLAPKRGLSTKVDLTEQPGRFPAAHHDALDVAHSLSHASGTPIAIGGASAGANIAAGVALALRDIQTSLLTSMVLAYGTFHAALPERNDVEADLRGPLAKWAFNPAMTEQMNVNYVGSTDALVPGHAFPGGADLHGLPPALVLNAKNDRLRRSGDAFADELRAARVEVTQQTVDALHGFLGARLSRGFKLGNRLIADWLNAHDSTVAA